jgi:hypothetical protein
MRRRIEKCSFIAAHTSRDLRLSNQKEILAMFRCCSILSMLATVAIFSSPVVAGDLPNRPVAPPPPVIGQVHFSVLKVGFIVGIGGGDGTLIYNGTTYPLSVGGISVGTIGIAGMELTGTASNLQNPADIVGTYGGASASLAIVGGGKVAQLQNEHGVILEVQGAEVGFEASLNLGGMTVAFR